MFTCSSSGTEHRQPTDPVSSVVQLHASHEEAQYSFHADLNELLPENLPRSTGERWYRSRESWRLITVYGCTLSE